jgi:hypothetical protein
MPLLFRSPWGEILSGPAPNDAVDRAHTGAAPASGALSPRLPSARIAAASGPVAVGLLGIVSSFQFLNNRFRSCGVPCGF